MCTSVIFIKLVRFLINFKQSDKLEFVGEFECVMIIVGTGVLDCPKNEYQIIN